MAAGIFSFPKTFSAEGKKIQKKELIEQNNSKGEVFQFTFFINGSASYFWEQDTSSSGFYGEQYPKKSSQSVYLYIWMYMDMYINK